MRLALEAETSISVFSQPETAIFTGFSIPTYKTFIFVGAIAVTILLSVFCPLTQATPEKRIVTTGNSVKNFNLKPLFNFILFIIIIRFLINDWLKLEEILISFSSATRFIRSV